MISAVYVNQPNMMDSGTRHDTAFQLLEVSARRLKALVKSMALTVRMWRVLSGAAVSLATNTEGESP
jgi:hypothetical protein